jgi:hypothetical protein
MRAGWAWILILAAFTPASGAESWRVGGKRVHESAWSKTDGGFGAQLVLTDDPEALFAGWQKDNAAFFFRDAGTARRGEAFVAVVFFTGCTTDPRGLCDATVRYTAFSPDGKPYGKPLSGELWSKKAPPPPDGIQLGVGNMGIMIEPGDPLGRYKVRAEILDNVGRKMMVLERSFPAVEGDFKTKK